MSTRNRAVITGMGVLAPNGNSKDAYWKSLVDGRSGIGAVTLFDASDLPCRIAGEVKDFDPHRYIDPTLKPKKRMARASQFGIAATRMALDDAGLDLEALGELGEVPVVFGVSTSAMDLFANPPTMFTASASVPHAVGSAVAYTLGFDARLFTVSDGCASGLDALGVAAGEIEQGKADVVVAGSAESAITHYVFQGFARSRILSKRNDEPRKASRPFDRDRDGGVISEGAGVLILENLEHALGRGANVYAEITGYGASADPAESPPAAGMALAMRRALANACRRPEQIEHISAHAPSDAHMDRVETKLIKDVFGSHAYRIPVTSVKGATGNAMAVAGVHQFIGAALSIKHALVPPTANLENPDPECDLDCVSGSALALPLSIVLVNTHGFGRGNSSLVLERVG